MHGDISPFSNLTANMGTQVANRCCIFFLNVYLTALDLNWSLWNLVP